VITVVGSEEGSYTLVVTFPSLSVSTVVELPSVLVVTEVELPSVLSVVVVVVLPSLFVVVVVVCLSESWLELATAEEAVVVDEVVVHLPAPLLGLQ
jgi:hypothetical protein